MLINIQLLRFLAAMLVVVYHTSHRIPGLDDATHGLFYIGQAIGFAGVDIFFVISGFIMAFTTMGSQGAADSSRFARRRLARIYSGYWPFFALAWLVFSWTRPGHVQESDLLTSFLLWPEPLNQVLLEVTWTLSFELYFYLLFSVLVWLAPHHRRLPICLSMTGIFLGLALYRHFVLGSFGPVKLYSMPFFEHFLASPFLVEFFAGAVLAYLLDRWPRGSAWPWLLGGSALFLLSGLINLWVFDGKIEQGYFVVPRVLWFGSAAVMLVAGLVRLEHRGHQASRTFSVRAGGASYAIYLSHVPLLGLAAKLGFGTLLAGLPAGLVSLGWIALMAVIAVLSILHYEKLERPLHHFFRSALRA